MPKKIPAIHNLPEVAFTYMDRACECCGSSAFESLWRYEYQVRTRSCSWLFKVNNVICSACGFVFVSPVPTSEDLQRYYQDSHSYLPDQSIGFSVENRLQFLAKCSRFFSVEESLLHFLEVGSNSRNFFHDQLEQRFKSVITVEINNEVNATYQSLSEVEPQSMDVLACYFVLEHIPDLSAFLANCSSKLKEGGIMIIEIPDISLYPGDIAALIFHEHVNHFSLQKTIEIFKQAGFDFLTSSHELCSQKFGFCAAFRKTGASGSDLSCSNEYSGNKELFLSGVRTVKSFQERVQKLYEQMAARCRQGETVLLWGANNNLKYFLGDKTLPPGAFVIDSNPLKAGFLESIPVYQPDQLAEEISSAGLLLLFAAEVHRDAIVKTLEQKHGKYLSEQQIQVVAY